MHSSGIVTAYTYDDEGRLTSCDIAPESSTGNGSSSDSSAESGTEDSEVDPADTYDGVDLKVSYTLDEQSGNTVTAITDANKNQKTETTNAAGLTTAVSDIDNGEDNTITVGYEFDELGRKEKENYADKSYVKYTYENESQRISTRTAYEADGTVESAVTYTYDGYGRITAITCKNSSGSQYCKTEYTYDAEGKVLTEGITYSGKSKQTITYTYDAEGRLASRTYPSGTGLETLNFAYDAQGNCTSIKQGASLVRAYTYDGFGRVITIKDYDKPGSSSFIQTSYTYDSFGRATSMVSTNDGNSGSTIESLTYTYDDNGNISTYNHVNSLAGVDETRVYVYDDHGRLEKSTKTDNITSTESVTSYEYDFSGNRTFMTVDGVMTEYKYNGLDQLITATTGDVEVSYEYDDRGNQIKETTATVGRTEGSETSTVTEIIATEYAVTGEMTKLTESNGSTTTLTQTNVYNQDGQRISRTQSGTTRSYFYDNGVVAYTEDDSSVSSANILAEDGAAIGTYRGSTYYSYMKDMQGSTTNIVKEDGTLSVAYDYTDFGETIELAGASFDNQIRYTGGICDEETELYYLNARYYDPETGRFISQDSYRGELDDPGQWHLYAYCANDPINYVDNSGNKSRRYSYRGTKSEILGYGLTIQASVGKYMGSSSVGASVVWFNKNVKTRYQGRKTHAYIHYDGSINSDKAGKALSILKRCDSVYEKYNLPHILKKLNNGCKIGGSLAVLFYKIEGQKNKFDSYRCFEGSCQNIGFSMRNFALSAGWSKSCTTIGVGISTSGLSASYGTSKYWFSSTYTRLLTGTYSETKVKNKVR